MSSKLFLIACCIYYSLAKCSKLEYYSRDERNEFSLMKLPYLYEALEPSIWNQIIYYHHKKHHQEYVDSLNSIIYSNSTYKDLTAPELLQQFGTYDEELGNSAGGYYNHCLLWWTLQPTSCKLHEPSGKLKADIASTWGSFESFKQEFSKFANGLFGSGWVWLCASSGKLYIKAKIEEFNPLIGRECIPVFGIDVWEHSYYLFYTQNRDTYITNLWNIVDWDLITYLYEKYALNETPIPV